jgi:secondary thiamine-phosphate synthase enzyme
MKVVRREFTVRTDRRNQMVDVTGRLRKILAEEKAGEGRVTVTVPHTTAGVTINEHADPAVAEDILQCLDDLIPWEGRWRHREGNAAAHVKASLVGSAVTLTVVAGSPRLGTWQGVFFCEFDGPRKRTVWLTVEISRPSGSPE